jgi:hypothetical protein
MAAVPVVGDMGVGMINKMFGTNYMTPTEAFQHLFTKLGVPEPQSAAEHVVMAAARAGSESLATSGAAAISAPGMQQGTAKRVVQSLAENPIPQAVAATTGAAAAETANQTGAPAGVQALAGFTGALIGGGASQMSTTSRAALRQQVANAERQGLTPITSDVLRPRGPFGNFTQRMRESIPLTGTSSVLAGQQDTKIQAARNLLREYGVDLTNPSIDRVTQDLIDNRRGQLIRYTTMRREAMDNAAASGYPTVATPRAAAALQNQINNLRGSEDYAPVVTILQGYLRQLRGINNIDNIEMLREAMGNRFNAPELANYANIGQRAINSIYRPLRDDMEQFIRTHGTRRDVDRFNIASRRLTDSARELRNRTLRRVLNDGEITAEAAANLLFSNTRSNVQALYNGLTPAGRQAARAAILERAWENMSRNNAGINPDRFARELKRMGTQVGVMFRGDDLQRARGFVQAIELLERSGKYAANPQTGVVGQIPMVGGSIATIFGALTKGTQGAIGSAAAVLGTGAIGRIYESPTVRDILLRFPTLRPDSPERMALANKLVAAIEAYRTTSEDKK